MIRRKLTKATPEEMKFMKSKRKFKELLCCKCGEEYVTVPSDVGNVTCAECIMGFVGGTGITRKKTPEEKNPRGWKFMKRYTSPSGKMFVRGEEVTEFPSDDVVVEATPKDNVKKKAIKEKKEVKAEEPIKRKRGRPPKNKK